MKDLIACYLIVSPLADKFKWLASYKNRDWKAGMAVSAAFIRRHTPSGFLRAAKLGSLALAISVLIQSSSEKPIQMVTTPVHKEIGEASWYGPGFHGKETASGEIFDTNEMTAAHPSLPLGTKVEVTNLEKNKTVEVKINDRGPYAKGRDIDLSRAAAKKLGMVKKGTAKVKIVAKPVKKKTSKKKSVKKKTKQTAPDR